MTFSYVFTVLRRRWVMILCGVVVGVAVGTAFAMLTPVRYSATASLVVSPVVSNPFSEGREEVNIRTEQEILGSPEVAERASEALGVPLAPGSYLLSHVDVAAPSGSQILEVTVQADSPEQAAEAANALGEAYLEFRSEGAEETADRYLERLDNQLAELEEQADAEANQGLIETLREQRLDVTLTGAEPGRIIGRAVPPSSPSSPGLRLSLPAGLVGGAILGIAAAILRERADRRVRTTDRLSRAVAPAVVVGGSDADRDFWEDLADEALWHVREGTDLSDVRVLARAVGPLEKSTVQTHLGGAVDELLDDLSDPRSIRGDEGGLDRGGSSGARRRDPEAARVPREVRARVAVISNGASPASVRRAGRKSDVAIALLTPAASLQEAGELVSGLRGTGLEVVVGLVEDSSGSGPQPGAHAGDADEAFSERQDPVSSGRRSTESSADESMRSSVSLL